MSNGGALRKALDNVKNTTASASRSQILKRRLESLRQEPEQRLLEIAQSSDAESRDGDNRDAMVERLQKALQTASTIAQGHENKAVAKCLAIAAKIELKDRRDDARALQEQVPSRYLPLPGPCPCRSDARRFTSSPAIFLQACKRRRPAPVLDMTGDGEEEQELLEDAAKATGDIAIVLRRLVCRWAAGEVLGIIGVLASGIYAHAALAHQDEDAAAKQRCSQC